MAALRPQERNINLELTSKQRAQLRGLANSIDTILIIGKDGIGADIIPRGDVTGLPKKKKKEPEELQARKPMPKISEDILELAKILRDQIKTVDQDIINLENEVRQLKIKKEHYEEIIRVFDDWRGIRHE